MSDKMLRKVIRTIEDTGHVGDNRHEKGGDYEPTSEDSSGTSGESSQDPGSED